MLRKIFNRIYGKWQPRKPESSKEMQEFGKVKKGIITCPNCYAIYTKKRWIFNQNSLKLNYENINFQLCPACQMIKQGLFEGQIIIKNIPPELKQELINMVNNFGEQASKHDPMDRISKITVNENKIEILTTENQLAQRIANKIRDAFNKVQININRGERKDVVRITINFNF